jgi:hypothetical protein
VSRAVSDTAGARLVFGLLGVDAAAIVVTYSRLPPRELYHVSGSSLEGGLSRALVFLDFPVALIAIGVVGALAPRLRRSLAPVAVLAVVLCAAVFWPGVVDQTDLDARPVNAVAAAGVALALALSLTMRPTHIPVRGSDAYRLWFAAALVLFIPPWVAADLGFFLDGVPLLGRIYRTGGGVAVHHGHHHGLDGFLLVVSALFLSRGLPVARPFLLRAGLALYLALMAVYGVGNIANDFWTEQVVKRGWTPWRIPNVLEPRASWAWLAITALSLAVWGAYLTSVRARR